MAADAPARGPAIGQQQPGRFERRRTGGASGLVDGHWRKPTDRYRDMLVQRMTFADDRTDADKRSTGSAPHGLGIPTLRCLVRPAHTAFCFGLRNDTGTIPPLKTPQ